MKWTEMNYRHAQWNHGYRYFTTWNKLGMWSNNSAKLRDWLIEHYGPARLPIYGPLPRELSEQDYWYWRTPNLCSYPNPNWTLDKAKRRIYVTKELMILLTLMNKN